MSIETEIVCADDYEEIAMEFQTIQALELDETLRECGIDNIELRKQFCERFSFGMGNFLDQYFFKVKDKTFYPLLCFSEQFVEGENCSDLKKLYLRSPYYEFHSNAYSCVESYFNGDEVKIGVVGFEDKI